MWKADNVRPRWAAFLFLARKRLEIISGPPTGMQDGESSTGKPGTCFISRLHLTPGQHSKPRSFNARYGTVHRVSDSVVDY